MASEQKVTFFTAGGSSSSRRVQLALDLKGIKYRKEVVQDRENPSEEFLRLNPLKQVPVVIIDGQAFSQSLAIVELLEERWPSPALLPLDSVQRTQAREIANIVVSGIQPYQNGSGPLPKFVAERMTGMTLLEWKIFWVDRGFTGLEQKLNKTAGRFCVGDNITVADICLVPQYVNARDKFKMDLGKFPTLKRIAEHCLSMEPFKSVCICETDS